uniref:Si:ch211-111e20.1 n=1 Tax=Fundulus heteroclitus TaxID=8078 RepID=A0A3Q2QF48_FUNHE
MLSSYCRSMSTLREEIQSIILKALPNLSEETQSLLISRFQGSGLESKGDLKYVQQEDMADLLPVIQLRKLLDAFKSGNAEMFSSHKLVVINSIFFLNLCLYIIIDKLFFDLETEVVILDLQSLPCPTPLSSPSLLECSLPPSSPSTSLSDLSDCSTPSNSSSPFLISKTWPETFQVPWDKMPPEVCSAIANKKRPTPAERRQMVRVLVDEMRKYEANPTRSQCLTVCRNIVRQYPQSFADVFADGSLMAGGYTLLLIQVKTRIENLNRDSNFARHRASRSSGSSSGCKRGPTDSYGCTRFQPELPPEETDDTIEQKRQRLEEIYRQEGARGIERAEVSSLMEITFSPAIEDLRRDWPYLFHQRSIYAHFQLNVLRLLELSMEECGRAIIEYFQSKSTNKATFSPDEDTEVALHVVQLLMAHFKESIDGLILSTDVSGKDRVTAGHWMISLESHIVCEGIQPTFVTGLAALFSMYYIFNLQYQEEAACTLEFIQRRFLDINPERGTKASCGKIVSKRTGKTVQKKSVTVNPHVSTLLKNLMDFEWNFI